MSGTGAGLAFHGLAQQPPGVANGFGAHRDVVGIVDLAAALCPECRQEEVGCRPGEKLHEMLIMKDEARQTVEQGDRYVILPRFPWWEERECRTLGGERLPEGFEYTSDTNPNWISVEALRRSLLNGSLGIEAPVS